MPRRLAALLLALVLLPFPLPHAAAQTPAEKTNKCDEHFPSDDLTAWTCVRIKNGQTLESLFDDKWKVVARFNRIDRRHAYEGVRIKVPVDLKSMAAYTPMPKIYRPAAKDPKFILVVLSEEFLGAYEYGKLVFSAPIADGKDTNKTPRGYFRITAYSPNHVSSKYFIEDTDTLYPMHWALRFYIDREGVSFWLHGRDLPGYPASHGCIGLYDEDMQKEYYKSPPDPQLEDAKKLYKWAIGDSPDDGKFHTLKDGPRLFITDEVGSKNGGRTGPHKEKKPYDKTDADLKIR